MNFHPVKTDMDCVVVWNNCLTLIKDNVNSQTFKTWFEPIKPIKLENNVLTIQVPSQFYFEVLEAKFVSLLRKTLKRYLGNDAKLEYSIIVGTGSEPVHMPGNTLENTSQNPPVNMPISNQSGLSPLVMPGLKKINIPSQLNPNYRFDNFIEGDCNKVAKNAGQAIAVKPGHTAYNPLFVHGGTGLGKSHLAQAIGNEIKRIYPNKVVLYMPSEKFGNNFVEATKNGNVNEFMTNMMSVDVLIVDDIQFLTSKDKFQDAFFQIFNALHTANKQIVLTSDVSAQDLRGIEERLISRFKWGLTTDLSVPDQPTRVAILKQKMYNEGVEIADEVTEYIAYNISNNVRELEGAIISLLAQATFSKKDIDMNLAKQVVKNFVRNVNREISIETIQNIVGEYFKIAPEKLKDKIRKREIAQARQIAMYFTKEFTKSSLKTIGLYFGGRDHSTVIHAINTVNDLCDTDKEFKKYVEDIRKKIQMTTN